MPQERVSPYGIDADWTKLYVDGEWRESESGETIDVEDPSCSETATVDEMAITGISLLGLPNSSAKRIDVSTILCGILGRYSRGRLPVEVGVR